MTHVDASKKSVEAAQGQRRAFGHDRPADPLDGRRCRKFAAREVRRGRRYDGIILDPPKFGPRAGGRGLAAGGRAARPDRRLPQAARRRQPFLVLTVYAVRMSALAIGEVVCRRRPELAGTVEVGEMAVREEARGLLLPTAIFARWSR